MMKKIIDDVMAYITFTLILIGIGGLSFDTFKVDGLLERFLGVVWEAEVRQPLLITPIVGGALFLVSFFLRGGISGATSGKANLLNNIPVYILMACGAYYLFQWLRYV